MKRIIIAITISFLLAIIFMATFIFLKVGLLDLATQKVMEIRGTANCEGESFSLEQMKIWFGMFFPGVWLLLGGIVFLGLKLKGKSAN